MGKAEGLALMDTRFETAKRWRAQADRYAHEEEDWFSAYFAGYIALAICSAIAYSWIPGRGAPNPDEETWEREEICRTMKAYGNVLAKAMLTPEGNAATTALRQREVPGPRGPLMIGRLTPPDRELEAAAKFLHEAWSPLSPMNLADDRAVERHADALALLLRKMRNRLFHGKKNFDPHGNDFESVRCLVPVLLLVVDTLMAEIPDR